MSEQATVEEKQIPVEGLEVKRPHNTLEKGEKNAKTSEFLRNIVENESATAPEDLLDKAPEIDMTLIQEFAPQRSLLLISLKFFLGFLFMASIAAALFFTSQLSDRLDFFSERMGYTNVSQERELLNKQTEEFQAEFNYYRFLHAKESLDQFSYLGDGFIQNYQVANSQTADEKAKDDARKEMADVKTELSVVFSTTRDLLAEPLDAELHGKSENMDKLDNVQIFKDAALSQFNQRIKELGQNEDPAAAADKKKLIQAKQLIGNNKVKNLLVKTDFADLSDKETYDFIKEVNALITNDLSVMQQIKEERIKWSDIIDEIDIRTRVVDRYYNTSQYENIGGIRYTSYDFDTNGQNLTLIGETKRFDTLNFTVLANLIDEFNRSSFFKGAEMRSFSKNGDTDNGFTAQLKLNLALQGENEIDPNDSEVLDEFPDFIIPAEEKLLR